MRSSHNLATLIAQSDHNQPQRLCLLCLKKGMHMERNQQSSDGCLLLLLALAIRLFGPFLLQLLVFFCLILFFALMSIGRR